MPERQEQAKAQSEPLREATCESLLHLHVTRHKHHRLISSVGGDMSGYVEIKLNEAATIRAACPSF
jgi:hypothetical protein